MDQVALRQLRVRLLYPPSVAGERIAAAEAGLGQLAQSGILVESACSDDKRAFRRVKFKRSLRSITSPDSDIYFDKIPYSVTDKCNSDFGITNVFGIAITPHRILVASSENTIPTVGVPVMAQLPGFSTYLEYAAVSLDLLRHPESPERDVIMAFVKRQAGQLFIRAQQTCPDERCLRSSASCLDDFVRRLVIPGLGFCQNCLYDLEETIGRIKNDFFGDLFCSARR